MIVPWTISHQSNKINVTLWVGKTMSLEPMVVVKFMFKLEAFVGDTSKPTRRKVTTALKGFAAK